MARLDSKFFLRDTVAAAQDLLGRYLIRSDGEERIVCRITETEAYVGATDKALPCLRRPAHSPDGDPLCRPRHVLRLPDLRHVQLPQLRHGTGRGSRRHPDTRLRAGIQR